ncbi:unnamed protein product, partial [Laminaria digitata]
TQLITAELRELFVAMHVEGDGNCFWRSVAMAIWGTDEKWRQLKLMVLGWATAHANSLVGEGGI